MEFKKVEKRAIEIGGMYGQLEEKKYGRKWGASELLQGFMGDVGDLAKLITAKEGMREIKDVDKKLEHELADCLWAVMVIANQYNIDLEKAFTKTMNELEGKLRIKN